MEIKTTPQKINTCLWFNANAEEAVNFYTSVFKNSRITQTSYYGKAGSEMSRLPPGHILTIAFELEGQVFTALNGGIDFPFSLSVSFVVNCDTQAEIDHYWEKLSDGGTEEQCGWLKDRFGLSWQIVPTEIVKLMTDKLKGNQVMEALLKMKKINLAILKKAAEQ